MRERGVRTPQLCIVDGSKGLRAAVQQTWPQAAIQRCTVHKLRNLLAAAPKRLHDELRADYDAIILAADGAAARRAHAAFVKKWSKTCPGVVKSLDEAGDELLTMYRYPRSQWKGLRTTNGIERLYLEFRRRVKTQGSLPNEGAVLALLYGRSPRPDPLPQARRLAGHGDGAHNDADRPGWCAGGLTTDVRVMTHRARGLQGPSDHRSHTWVSHRIEHATRSLPPVALSPERTFHINRDTAFPEWRCQYDLRRTLEDIYDGLFARSGQ